MPARHLARLAERGSDELVAALSSIADAARSGTNMASAVVARIEGARLCVLAVAPEDGGTGPTSLTERLDSRVVAADEAVELPDAKASDPRAAALGVGSYAGVPLRRINGQIFGTLSVFDPEPRRSLSSEVEFLTTLSRLATHEIGLLDNLQRLIEDVKDPDEEDDSDEADPVGDLQGLGALAAAALRRTGPHDEARLRRALARVTSRFAREMVDVILKSRHLSALPGNLEPWGTDVDELVKMGASLLPTGQGARIHIDARSSAFADIPRRHLERILVNLVYRAWRAAPPPTPISVESRPRAGAVEIIVEDSGPAVPPDQVPELFEQTGRGLLGLSVVRELAARAGGSVRYERQLLLNRIVVRLPLSGTPRLVEPEPALDHV